MPELAEHVWYWYSELYNGERISYQEIEAWSRLTGTHIEPWEVAALKRIELEQIKSRDD